MEKLKIISGGQTGVDRAALDVAIKLRIPYVGWCPAGRLAEDGVIPEKYLLQETESGDYKERTLLNIRDSDGTLIIIPGEIYQITDGTVLTITTVKEQNKPYFILDLSKETDLSEVVNWIIMNKIKNLNIAGPRESQCCGIYSYCFKILERLILMISIKPFVRLLSQLNDCQLEYKSVHCCYGDCEFAPIKSHTIPENFLKKLNQDLKEVLVFENRLSCLYDRTSPELMKKLDKQKFSTFTGFCDRHDNDLFNVIDEFNGQMNAEKALLILYRNLCYGIHHIQTQILKLTHVAKQSFISSEEKHDEDAEKVHELLKSDILLDRLKYCLLEHQSRKEKVELALELKQYDLIEFVEADGDSKNPLFCGRSTYLMHQNDSFFSSAGYCYMPWVSYITLLHNNTSKLVFCWLKSDSKYVDYFKLSFQDKQFGEILAVLAYACSDSFAVSRDFYKKHKDKIDLIIKNWRVY